MAYMAIETAVRTHKKFLAAGPAASWLWICGLGYCQDGLTDGFIPEAALNFLGVVDAAPLVRQLVQVRLWEQVEGGWRMHDYLEHNKPAEVVREIMRKRRAGGMLGGRPRKQLLEGLPENLEGYPPDAPEGNLPENPVLDGTVRDGTTGTPAKSGEPVLLTFSTVGPDGDSWRLRRAQVDEWAKAFPGLDVLAECTRAQVWIEANPGRRKTVRGMPKFLVGWLMRSTDNGTGARRQDPLPQPAERPDWYAQCQQLHKGRCGGQFKHGVQMRADANRAKGAAS